MSAARILPPEEWHRLDDETREFYETMAPEDVAVVVVEMDGAIVARLAVLRVPHWESFWMAPEKAGNAGVMRALLRAATEQARKWAPHWIYANADNEATVNSLKRLGGQWMPMHTFLLSLGRMEMEDACRRLPSQEQQWPHEQQAAPREDSCRRP